MPKQELANWLCRYRLSKYNEDIEPYRANKDEASFHARFTPYEAIEGRGNCLLDTGIDEIWDLVTGAASGGDHIFDNSGSRIGIGDSDTATAAAQTDLQAATNKTYKGMESGYPTSSTQKAIFKASLGNTEANYA